MNSCDSHEGIMVVWDESVDSCPLCNTESMLDDLFCASDKIDHEIGGTELAQMPVEIAKKIVGFKKVVQDLGVEKERTSCAPRQESVNSTGEYAPPNKAKVIICSDTPCTYCERQFLGRDGYQCSIAGGCSYMTKFQGRKHNLRHDVAGNTGARKEER